MPRFYIEVEETLARVIGVTAPDLSEAMAKTEDAYKNGEIILTAEDFVGDEKYNHIPDYESEPVQELE